MARMDEHEVFARFIGEKVNLPRLESIARKCGTGSGSYADSKEYVIAHIDYYNARKFRERFGLTPTLTERRDYKGTDFRIYLYAREGIITGGHVFKYIDTSTSCHDGPTGYETDATQQELRVVASILTYLTSKE